MAFTSAKFCIEKSNEQMESSMKNKLNVHIITVDADIKFAIPNNYTGKQLFDQVVKTIGVREIWYFGLQYDDSKGNTAWLKFNKKVSVQDVKKDNKDAPYVFKFLVKFYPEEIDEELIQPITQKLFYLQIKQDVMNEKIYCPPETAVLLASYALQAEYGVFNENIFNEKGVNGKMLPQKVINQHSLTSEEWKERIIHWWKQFKDMMSEDAISEYLKIAQDLEMYGVNYFEIKNKKGSDLYLGVNALGVNVYERDDRLSPKIGFPWNEIGNISIRDKKFIIKSVDKKSLDFVFFVTKSRKNKRILSLSIGYHELYLRRRKPDTMDIQQMKAKAKVEKEAKISQRHRLTKEKKAREDAEKENHKLAQRLEKFEEEARIAQEALDSAKIEVAEKEIQRMEAEKEAKRLLILKEEVELERQRLKEEAKAERIEKEEYEKRAAVAKEEAERRDAEIKAKQQEAERLQQELIESQKREEEQQQELLKIVSIPPMMVQENDIEGEGSEQRSGFDVAESDGRELEYTSTADKNPDLKYQLQSLGDELNKARDSTKTTREDVLHLGNLKEGRDKYKTLRQIREGNTRQRIDEFEAL